MKKKKKQTGKSNYDYDKRYSAKKPGWRKSEKSGKYYYENRKNRSDVYKYI